jgi:hypothetical protein
MQRLNTNFKTRNNNDRQQYVYYLLGPEVEDFNLIKGTKVTNGVY